jgi:hypothetical protein
MQRASGGDRFEQRDRQASERDGNQTKRENGTDRFNTHKQRG